MKISLKNLFKTEELKVLIKIRTTFDNSVPSFFSQNDSICESKFSLTEKIQVQTDKISHSEMKSSLLNSFNFCGSLNFPVVLKNNRSGTLSLIETEFLGIAQDNKFLKVRVFMLFFVQKQIKFSLVNLQMSFHVWDDIGII